MLKIAHHEIYNHPLPENHRFPMDKYDLLPQQLLYEGTCTEANFFQPEIPNDKHFFNVHTPEYFYDLLNITLSKKAERKIGFPLTEQLIGTHHAFSDRGEGFCILNDQAIGARYLQKKGLANKILIVDLDVHQGNGTAEIFEGDASVFTFSMHGKANYPFEKEKSDLDIPLETGTKDKLFLNILYKTLPELIKTHQPDFIYYLCGVDVLESDKLGKLSLSLEGCKKRDRFVLQTCFDNKIPVMCSMGGGYSDDIKIIVEAHTNTFRLAQEIFF